MKKIMIILLGLWLTAAVGLTQDSQIRDIQFTIVGQWVNQNNNILEFTETKQVFLNGQKYGSFRPMVDADFTIIVDLSGTSKSTKKYFKFKRNDKNQWELLDISSKDPFEEKVFIRLVVNQEATDK